MLFRAQLASAILRYIGVKFAAAAKSVKFAAKPYVNSHAKLWLQTGRSTTGTSSVQPRLKTCVANSKHKSSQFYQLVASY